MRSQAGHLNGVVSSRARRRSGSPRQGRHPQRECGDWPDVARDALATGSGCRQICQSRGHTLGMSMSSPHAC